MAAEKIAFDMSLVQVENPNELNFIFGQSHFVKTVFDLYEVCITSGTAIKFGLAAGKIDDEKLAYYVSELMTIPSKIEKSKKQKR